MRFERLILESGTSSVSVRFHDRLTVVAGLGRTERELLGGELLGGLVGNRVGTHVEIVEDNGRRLGVVRRKDLSDKVTNMETGEDVTAEFTRPDGRVDVLARLGLDLETARQRCRMSADDVAAAGLDDTVVARLAAVDQDQLWSVAERVCQTDANLKAEAEAIGGSAEDAPLIEEIERRHLAVENAQRRHEQVRHLAIFIGAACALGAAPAALLNRVAALPFLAIAMLTTLTSIYFRRRMAKARTAERKAVEAAGARSYVDFHLARINRLLGDGSTRERVGQAAANHRQALDEWHGLAGNISAEVAFGLRDRVLAAVRRGGGTEPERAGINQAQLAQALIMRFTELRHGGTGGEAVPLILDEPLVGLEVSEKLWALELIGRTAGSPQMIYLTEDQDVAAWAHHEALADHLAVIAPTSSSEEVASSHS